MPRCTGLSAVVVLWQRRCAPWSVTRERGRSRTVAAGSATPWRGCCSLAAASGGRRSRAVEGWSRDFYIMPSRRLRQPPGAASGAGFPSGRRGSRARRAAAGRWAAAAAAIHGSSSRACWRAARSRAASRRARAPPWTRRPPPWASAACLLGTYPCLPLSQAYVILLLLWL